MKEELTWHRILVTDDIACCSTNKIETYLMCRCYESNFLAVIGRKCEALLWSFAYVTVTSIGTAQPHRTTSASDTSRPSVQHASCQALRLRQASSPRHRPAPKATLPLVLFLNGKWESNPSSPSNSARCHHVPKVE